MADPGRLDEMVREVQAFAEHMQWRTWTVPELVEQGHIKNTGLRGITVSIHPGCESLHLHIDDEGRFVNHMYHAYIHDAETRAMFIEMMQHTIGFYPESIKRPGPEMDAFCAQGLTYNWLKTQHGGPASHVQACTLLRFVRDRYAPELEVTDDTGYFVHGRLDELEGHMGQIDQVIHLFKRAVERVQEEGGVSDLQGLLDRLQHYVNEQRDMMH